MFKIGIDQYSLLVHRGPLPSLYDAYRKRAALSEEFALHQPDGETCLVAVGPANDLPSLVVAQRFEPCAAGFDPGVLLVSETRTLFIGAGVRLLAYTLDGPRRLWEDDADTGFWCWNRHGDHVVMSAELELAAWDLAGRKLWTTFVEPPWTYRVIGEEVHLDVMGRLSQFDLHRGPIR